tara:strand:+ start:4439 stop:5119 length:681 start_codon:yes stop_codon:yes gene_type:complete
MSLAGIFDTYYPSTDSYDYDFGFDDDFGGSFTEPFSLPDTQIVQTSLGQDFAGFLDTDDFGNVMTDTAIKFVPDDEVTDFFDDRSLAKQAQDFLFRNLGVGEETAKAISAFAKAANRGGGKQAQAQGRGRVGPGLPSSARAPTTAAGRTSRARQATSGERAVQSAISQSNRAQSAARAIANQMARAGTVTSTNDLADMISGATSPKGTKQALPGTRLRQLAIPRTA